MKMKKLNRKGFTLIELLAVIVILAIVMGVAANAVLNVMNDSRKNTLQSSAKSAADAFRTAYAENQLKNSSTILGLSSSTVLGGTPTKLTDAGTSLNITTTNYELDKSYVYYEENTGSFTVCLVAKEGASYYLEKAATEKTKQLGSGSAAVNIGDGTKTMWACSDDTNSWTN